MTGEFSTILSALTGGGGAIVVAYLWIKAERADKIDLAAQLKEKNKAIVELTRESVAAITASLAKSDMDAGFQDRVLEKIDDMRKTLESLAERAAK